MPVPQDGSSEDRTAEDRVLSALESSSSPGYIQLGASNDETSRSTPLIPDDLRDLNTPTYDAPELAWGAIFCAGALALRYHPRRPGFLRRTTLWGLYCTNQYMWTQYGPRHRQLYEDARNDAVPHSKFWTLVLTTAYSSEHQKFIANLPHQLIPKYPHIQESLVLWKAIEQKMRNRSQHTLGDRLQFNLGKWLAGDEQARLFWGVMYTACAVNAGVSPDGTIDECLLLPSYMVLISNYDRWKIADVSSDVGALASGALALLVRNRVVLRLSLATGICSLAGLFASALATHHILHVPSKFTNWDVIDFASEHLA